MVVPNITQDEETGIGAWTDDEILRAVRDGVGRDGRLLMPPMPFTSWKNMSDEDARAIVAYLRTVPPVKNAVSREHNRIPWRLKAATTLGLVHHEPARDVKAPQRTDQKAYGAYLTKLGLCWECHSLGKMGPSDSQDVLMSGSRRPLSEPEYGKITLVTSLRIRRLASAGTRQTRSGRPSGPGTASTAGPWRPRCRSSSRTFRGGATRTSTRSSAI